jgi:hypothetical protein|eukprot:SAG25_NODE_1143_length_3810_cov_132.786390_4_plen_54_part_00
MILPVTVYVCAWVSLVAQHVLHRASQVIRYNQLLPVISRTLKELQKALKGTGE